jgi:hypothetical protein
VYLRVDDTPTRDAVVPRLRGRFGREYLYVDSTPSTQLLLDSDAPEGAVVVADEQTSGRGRLGRRWFAPAGTSLLCSLQLRPRIDPQRLPELTGVAALAAAEAIEAGLHGEVTAATQMLSSGMSRGAGDGAGDATIPLAASGTEATRAVRTGEATRPAPPPVRRPTAAPAPARTATAARTRPRPRRARRGLGRMLAVLLVIVAGVVAAFLIASGSGSAPQRPIHQDSVKRQLQGLRDYVRTHSR